MKHTSLLIVLIVCQQNLVEGAMLFGVPGDGIPDLIADGSALTIDTDGTVIASYDIRSVQGIFTGDASNNLGSGQVDTHFQIAGSILQFNGSHSLGEVIGVEWTAISLFDDLSFTLNSLFVRGDANDDGIINISDGTFILQFLFQGGPSPLVLDSADVNDDGRIDLSDGIYVNEFLFQGTEPPPPAPYPSPGEDPTPDDLDNSVDGALIVVTIPEPASAVLSALGFAVPAFWGWRRFRGNRKLARAQEPEVILSHCACDRAGLVPTSGAPL